jgi:hypothetical protein
VSVIQEEARHRDSLHGLVLVTPDPQIVEFEWSDDVGWFCPKESSTGRRSILLLINKESRKYYLKTYLPLACSKNAGFDDPLQRHERSQEFISGEAPNEVFNCKINRLYIEISKLG